jgi:hypothetical protein
MPNDRTIFRRNLMKGLWDGGDSSKIVSLVKLKDRADKIVDKLLIAYPHLLDEEVQEVMKNGFDEWEM